MTETPKCQTCGGLCSAPDVLSDDDVTGGKLCTDDWHKMADIGPAAVALLREWSAAGESMAWVQRVDDLLAALPVKP